VLAKAFGDAVHTARDLSPRGGFADGNPNQSVRRQRNPGEPFGAPFIRQGRSISLGIATFFFRAREFFLKSPSLMGEHHDQELTHNVGVVVAARLVPHAAVNRLDGPRDVTNETQQTPLTAQRRCVTPIWRWPRSVENDPPSGTVRSYLARPQRSRHEIKPHCYGPCSGPQLWAFARRPHRANVQE
jgi:hypothetical protein